VLKRTLASAGHYPPIDVLSSVSRLMDRVAEPALKEAARNLRGLLAGYADARDLISIGAYVKGSDPLVDQAIETVPAINTFLRQRADEITPFAKATLALAYIDPHSETPATAEDVVYDADATTIEEAGEAA